MRQERDYLQTKVEKLEKDNQELKKTVFELSQLLSSQVTCYTSADSVCYNMVCLCRFQLRVEYFRLTNTDVKQTGTACVDDCVEWCLGYAYIAHVIHSHTCVYRVRSEERRVGKECVCTCKSR